MGTDVPLPLLQAIADVPEAALHRGLAHLQAAARALVPRAIRFSERFSYLVSMAVGGGVPPGLNDVPVLAAVKL